MNDFIENLPGIAFCCFFTALQTYLFFNGRIDLEENQKITDDSLRKAKKESEEKRKLVDDHIKKVAEEKQQLIDDYRKKYQENGIILLKDFQLTNKFSLKTVINESFEYNLEGVYSYEYLYLTDSYSDFCFSKDIDISTISNPKRAITIGGRAEEYLREKEINLESKSIEITVLLKIQKNKKPKIRFKLKQQV